MANRSPDSVYLTSAGLLKTKWFALSSFKLPGQVNQTLTPPPSPAVFPVWPPAAAAGLLPRSPPPSSASSWLQHWFCWPVWPGSSRSSHVTAATRWPVPATWHWDTSTDPRPPECQWKRFLVALQDRGLQLAVSSSNSNNLKQDHKNNQVFC